MSDIFKDGVLYMEDLHDKDLLSDILKEQSQEINKKLEEQKLEQSVIDQNKKISDIQNNINFCLDEVKEKMLNCTSDIFFKSNEIVCSNGYILKINKNNGINSISILIPIED